MRRIRLSHGLSTAFTCRCSVSGERGAGLGQHIRAEHHEHGQSAGLPTSRWAGRPVGELALHRLFALCGRPGVSGPQSHPGRYRHERDTPRRVFVGCFCPCTFPCLNLRGSVCICILCGITLTLSVWEDSSRICCCISVSAFYCFQHVPLYSAPCLSMRWRKAKRWAQGPRAFFFFF